MRAFATHFYTTCMNIPSYAIPLTGDVPAEPTCHAFGLQLQRDLRIVHPLSVLSYPDSL